MKERFIKRVFGDWRVNIAFGVLALAKALKEQLNEDMYERNRSLAQAAGAFVLAGLNKHTFGDKTPEDAADTASEQEKDVVAEEA